MLSENHSSRADLYCQVPGKKPIALARYPSKNHENGNLNLHDRTFLHLQISGHFPRNRRSYLSCHTLGSLLHVFSRCATPLRTLPLFHLQGVRLHDTYDQQIHLHSDRHSLDRHTSPSHSFCFLSTALQIFRLSSLFLIQNALFRTSPLFETVQNTSSHRPTLADPALPFHHLKTHPHSILRQQTTTYLDLPFSRFPTLPRTQRKNF
mmetsp:Transcript_262/g.337  ORF Transcript_262/g.337 Transcript_262/m.337 type:complete len:207 (-) Transcript_262:243-863(-)